MAAEAARLVGGIMPRYDFKCPECGITFEQITPVLTDRLPCMQCSSLLSTRPNLAERQLSFPSLLHIH